MMQPAMTLPLGGVVPTKGAAQTEDVLKRALARAEGYAADRARFLRAKMDEFASQNGLAVEKETLPGKPQAVPGRDGGNLQADLLAYNRVKAAVPTIAPLVVREYAAPRPGSIEAESETSDTIFWQPVIVLPSDGRAKFHIDLGTAPGGYQVVIAGHTLDGRIGAVRGLIPIVPERPMPTAPTAPIPPTMP
jgi:hypothetical protein